jgi:hypothetical protein
VEESAPLLTEQSPAASIRLRVSCILLRVSSALADGDRKGIDISQP